MPKTKEQKFRISRPKNDLLAEVYFFSKGLHIFEGFSFGGYGLELDHLFLFVSNEAKAREMMETAGLLVNYSRVHPGQGTTNLCACLEDVFLELIWLDGSEISTESERITLGARGRGAGLPIGVSWRGDAPFEAEPDHIESYAAPFLRSGVTIPVAAESLDRRMPFFFRTPGGVPPAQRSDELVGNRQLPHYAGLMDLELSLQNADAARSLLGSLDRLKVVEGLPGLRFTLVDPQGTPRHRVVWTV